MKNKHDIHNIASSCHLKPHEGSTEQAFAIFNHLVGEENWHHLVDIIAATEDMPSNLLIELMKFTQPRSGLQKLWGHVEANTSKKSFLLTSVIPYCTQPDDLEINISKAVRYPDDEDIQKCLLNTVEELINAYSMDEEDVQEQISEAQLPASTLAKVNIILG